MKLVEDFTKTPSLNIRIQRHIFVQMELTLVRDSCNPYWLSGSSSFIHSGLAEMMIQMFTFEHNNKVSLSTVSSLHSMLSE